MFKRPAGNIRPIERARTPFALLAFLALGATASVAATDPCEVHRAKFGAHPLSLAGSITLQARDGTPTDADMSCLERIWTPRDGAIAAVATRGLLMVAAVHPAVAIQAAARRPESYREWMSDLGRFGLHDVNGEGALLRRSIAQLLAAPTADASAEAGKKLLLEGLTAVQPFTLR